MGIKHFFHWFKTNFKSDIKILKNIEKCKDIDISIDNLMLDLNGLLHSSTQKIYEYGEFKKRKRLLKTTTRRKKMGGIKQQLKVFKDVCANIESILLKVQPNKRLILCVDGPAPLSKQNQQRQRRFKSAMEKDDEEFKRFDSNAITPGTKFMDYLTKYIDWYIHKSISEKYNWKKIEIVFSNEKCPGEGEHKIINYIRKIGDKDESYCIYGLDADLIMLGLGTHRKSVYIMREDLYSSNHFMIDIGSTRNHLCKLLDWNDGDDNDDFNNESAVNDFIFMCFMVGNDFIPHIPSLEIIEGGIDQMIDVYKNVCEQYGHLTKKIDNYVYFRKHSVKVFLGTFAQYNKGILENKLLHKDKFYPDDLLETNAVFSDGKYNVNMEKYKDEYYNKYFNGYNIEDICHEYLDGLQWILTYYTTGVTDWKWIFKHHYGPFAHELAKYISTFQFRETVSSNPTKPFQQLLCVLPPKSAGLIPIPLSQLLIDSRSEIKKYCPSEFKVDLSGKRQAWEGIVILPMVDFNKVENEYNKYIDKVNKDDLMLNVTDNSYVYNYDNKEFLNVISSLYGDIKDCKVRKESISF